MKLDALGDEVGKAAVPNQTIPAAARSQAQADELRARESGRLALLKLRLAGGSILLAGVLLIAALAGVLLLAAR